MFGKLDYDTKFSFGVITNVLVLCLIGGSDKLRVNLKEDGTMASPTDCKHISEVLLLDLTTSEKRTDFFGSDCQACFEKKETQFLMDTVEKVIVEMGPEVTERPKAVKVHWRYESKELGAKRAYT
ncbi:hypothetical protein PRNP1_008018 [Phytophthora ramorum]